MITVKVIEVQKSLLETWKFFRPFPSTLTADVKYSLISEDNSMETIQRRLSQKQNIMFEFFSVFLEFRLNFEPYQKNMTLIAYVFPNLPTTKYVLR